MIRTKYGPASWRVARGDMIEIWLTPPGHLPTLLGLIGRRHELTLTVTGITVMHPFTGDAKHQQFVIPLPEESAKTKVIEMLIALGVINPIDYIAVS